MSALVNARRLVLGAASAVLLAGASVLGVSATAHATPAPSAVTSTVTGDRDHRHDGWDRHERCDGGRGQWANKWVKGHWEWKWDQGAWHDGYEDHHGNWHDGWWGQGHWKPHWAPGRDASHWVPGHWNCHDKR
ncbi:DUF2613 domain-containing protein [Streptomyces roseus]|uniref:Lipoprotein n=1 Tax=Streptomyces roseus TaxID=66430 RepID=A0A0J6XHC6_9ACTN|nr:DUF2613 domain-containing protein [Streptomyces roseus]KMO94559.1 hypothetical protein ACS04_28535 [Streptomyces roseus]